jgi:hypothetical protein
MPLCYAISTTIKKWFVFLYNFHNTEKTLLSFSDLEKITGHPVRQWAGTGKKYEW